MQPLPLVLTAAQRERAESLVDWLIQLLDITEPDADWDGGGEREDCCPAGDDVGSFERSGVQSDGMGAPGDADDAEDGGDREPNLGWTPEGDNGAAGDDDREQDDVDDEAETDQQGASEEEPIFAARPAALALNPEPCQPGPFQLVGSEWQDARFAR